MLVFSLIWSSATVYLLLYYLFFHSRLLFYKTPKCSFSEPVSLVICARNEARNLQRNLPVILTQHEVAFEVVVVNDRSTDATDEVLQRLKGQYPNLRVIDHFPPEQKPGKKMAVLAGIEAAAYSHLVFTDADCRPSSAYWLKGMAAHFQNKDVVLGFGPYRPAKHLASQLTQWETFLTAQHYFSFALAGMPYMGVGRNLAYSRKVFNDSDHFASHLQLASGDDDLFIGKVATKGNTAINLDPDTFMWSEPPGSFKNWWRQKQRHLTTSTYYRWTTAFLLATFGASQLLFYFLLPFDMAQFSPAVFWILFLSKFIVQMAVTLPLAVRLRQTGILWLLPVWEILTAFLLALIHAQNLIAPKNQKW